VNNTATAPTTLVMRHIFNAPIERVYDAWLTPEVIREFYCPDDIVCPSAEVDARPGGTYRIAMRHSDGEEFISYGVYRVLDRPNKIVCTQQWEEDDKTQERETVLTLEFRSLGPQSTELTLTHENFRDAEQRDRHVHGWSGCLEKLEGALR
jgi:uncharacterized protein YndB with AHSA1/START domain